MAVGDWEEIGVPLVTGWWGAYDANTYIFINGEIWRALAGTDNWSQVFTGNTISQDGGGIQRVDDRLYLLRAGEVYHADSNTLTNITAAANQIQSSARLPGTAKIFYNVSNTDFWEFDTEANTHTQRASIPYDSSRAGKRITGYKEHIYSLCGGISGTTNRNVARYNVAGDFWELLPSDMISGSFTGTFAHGVAALDNRIYIWGDSGGSTLHAYYDIEAEGWVRLDAAPVAMQGTRYTQFAGFHYTVASSDGSMWRFHATDVIEEGNPFTGEIAGAQIFPAPEKLPHIITMEDTEGNPRLQRKLQENFESLERQLLALDPDQESAEPQDR